MITPGISLSQSLVVRSDADLDFTFGPDNDCKLSGATRREVRRIHSLLEQRGIDGCYKLIITHMRTYRDKGKLATETIGVVDVYFNTEKAEFIGSIITRDALLDLAGSDSVILTYQEELLSP